MNLGKTVPILRMLDEAKAKTFYMDFVGFSIDFEHRFEPDLPLYMGISRNGCVLHLSEHEGDCTPGSAVRIDVDDVDAFAAELAAKSERHVRPVVQKTPWGTRETSLRDPSGNRLIFVTALPEQTSTGD